MKPHKALRYISLDYVRFVFIWRPRGSDSTQGVRQSHTTFKKIASHRIGEKGHGGQRAAMAALL